MFHSRAGTNCTREGETGSRALGFTFHDTSLNRYQTDENDNGDRLWQELSFHTVVLKQKAIFRDKGLDCKNVSEL